MIFIIGVVMLVYLYQGGMKVVVYGDVIQMIILFGGILICFGMGLYYLGGWELFIVQVDFSWLKVVDFSLLGLQKGEEFGFWFMLIGGLFLYIFYYGIDQSQVQCLFLVQDMVMVKKILLVNGLMWFFIILIYCVMGFILGMMVVINSDFWVLIFVDKFDLMIFIFIWEYLLYGIIGILMVVIFLVMMLLLSLIINLLSVVMMEDFFNWWKQLSVGQYNCYLCYVVLFWGLVCLVLVFFIGDIVKMVIEVINKIGLVFYGFILVIFVVVIGWK